MATTLKIHELSEELDPDEAGRMKQQSRVEAAHRLRDAGASGARTGPGQPARRAGEDTCA